MHHTPTQESNMSKKLQLREGARVHPVFHVSLLKKAIGDSLASVQIPQDFKSENLPFEPFAILQFRELKEGAGAKQQVLVQWKGFSEEEATWVELEEFQNQFPNYDLEDKAKVNEGSIDRDCLQLGCPVATDGLGQMKVYSRRKLKGIVSTAEIFQ
ncbi:hypothetical protein MANES_07G000550v8 [Manihot esculenta]|uniref:Uncharacterized protein n=1 Tax=Manihot esculenta TaxID=3983 RepID=A0ACB7HD61_MANES|nr:hypothetical protein MANES_07G000550v8 [Manihot esculenta]